MSELEAQAGPPSQPRITPQEIQEKEFRLSFRGYNERDVDEFLDQVTEAVAELVEENRRLRERLSSSGSDPSAEAEAILRRAREEADRIVRQAGERAARIADPLPPAERQAIGPFIAREREFLQGLAQLVQSHAEEIKEMVRRARERAEPAPAGPAGPPTGEAAPVADAARGGAEATPAEEEAEPAGVAAAPGRPEAPEPGEEPPIRVPEAGQEADPGSTGGPEEGPGGGLGPGGSEPEVASGPEPEDRPAPRPSPAFAERPASETDRRDREVSLRELFWGEE